MTKAHDSIQKLLDAVRESAARYASAGAEFTGYICDALLGGAQVEDVLHATEEGFLSVNNITSKGQWLCNIRRIAAAGPEHIRAVKASGNSLNNDLLKKLDVPKRTKAGRPEGQGAGKRNKETKTEQVFTPVHPTQGYTIPSALLTIQSMRATAPQWAPGQYALLTLLEEVIDALKGDVLSCTVTEVEDEEVEA